MALLPVNARISLDQGHFIYVLKNRCTGDAYLKLTNGQKGEREVSFYFTKETYKTILEQKDFITEEWDRRPCENRRSFSYVDGVMLTLPRPRVNGVKAMLNFGKYFTMWDHKQYLFGESGEGS